VAGLLVLLAVTIAATVVDAIGTIDLLNRTVQLQHEVCDIHIKIRLWESIAAHRPGIPPIRGPILGNTPDFCPRLPG